jgi:hypothetical protein
LASPDKAHGTWFEDTAVEIPVSLLQQVRVVSVSIFPAECSDSHLLGPSRTRTVERTPECNDFDNEKPQPKIGNLSTHTRTEHPNEYAGGAGSAQESSTNPIDHGYTAASAKLMEEFLENGRLNPKLYPMKKGFLKHFAAWLIEEDLPFTTGESYGIQRLFKYLDVTFQLPSDTTVRNALAKIYIELHGEVVRELSVSSMDN